MKQRVLFVVLIMMMVSLACNLPMEPAGIAGTVTPTGALDVLTLAAQTVQAGQTQAAGTPPAQTRTPAQATATSPVVPANTTVPPTSTSLPCDQAAFVQDVTIPDGTKMTPAQAFTKTWRLQNIGTCAWNNSYAMVFSGGDALGAPAVVNLPGNVPPGSMVDLSIDMKAPTKQGKYYGDWKLRNSTGGIFGVGNNMPIFIQIEVVVPTLTPTVTPTTTVTPTITVTPTRTVTVTAVSGASYDFSANLCKAEWRSQSGVLPCTSSSSGTGTPTGPQGYAQLVSSPKLENGTTETNPVILTVPDNTKTGAITGTYPAVTIQAGQHFQTSIGCLQGATQCSVIYQVNYVLNGGQPVNLGQFAHAYNQTVQAVDIDLSALAGKSIQVVLVVLADGSSEGDQAVWVNPRIVKP